LGTVIVLVGLAFLFPTPNTNEPGPEPADGTTPPTPERADIYAESRVDDEMADTAMPSNDTTFIRENDEDRANDYRMAELEEMKIQELLSSAAIHIEKLEYTEPPEGNALDDYRAALALNPSNAKANEGIVFIMDKLVESGLGMLDRDEVTRAGGIVDKIRQIESDSPQVSQLEQAVAAWRAEQETRRETERNEAIISMLKSAEDAMDQGKILSPARDNALHHYRELLLFDPGNDEAEQGVSSISQHYLGLANESILANDLGAAEGFLTTVEVIQADNPAIALLREQIDVKKRQEAIGLVQPPVDTPVVVESSTTPATAPGREPSLLPRPDAPAANLPSGGQPVPEVVDLSIAETAPGNPVLNNDERQLLAGLEAYYEGRYEEAYEYLTPLSYRGIARAQFRIGIMYQMGRGVTRDTARAEELITRALPAIRSFAEGGRAWAQADLGSLYEDGVVVTRDYEQAVHWYREGARQGYAGAQTNLGVMYALGRGVERSRDEAIRWLKLAADQGDLIATENLRTLGVRQE
jgi:tetratricopeptide (TPR) repeat protein